MPRLRNLTFAGVALAGGLALATLPASTAGASSRRAPTPAHIVATPDNVMVRHPITLAGTGFSPNSTLTIKECSKTTWVADQNPCDTDNAIRVATNSNGAFKGTMTAELCPQSHGPSTPLPAQTCYVGEPVPRGVDTIRLLGAARITVTYP